ncbi:hypothetical protein SDD30_11945 [Moorella naiadis]|uniref:hypothetical protein n=1 Tax=Moorella naiadis (nom. illeg.) TaxID=3093670 RepID=UPI003D9C8E79
MEKEIYLKLVTRELKLELKGEREHIREILESRLYDFLKTKNNDSCSQRDDPEMLERIDASDNIAAQGTEKEEAVSETARTIPTIAELRAKAKLNNNKELVAFVVFYKDYYYKEAPTMDDIRLIMKDELREKSTVVASVSTYLQRAKKEGWIDQDGKRWRMTGIGLQIAKGWLGDA